MAGVYRYDGSSAGLLTLLAITVPQGIIPDAICVTPPAQQSLFCPVTPVATDRVLAGDFRDELSRRLPPSALQQLRLAWHGDHPERELLLCRYLRLAWQAGARTSGMLAHPDVAPLWKLAQQVGREAHRYLGFVRFRETSGGFYYAAISPDHRILPLVAGHFAGRFSDQQWVLHDLKHGEGVVHDCSRRKWLLLPMENHCEPGLTPAEEEFQSLWRSYFTTLAISERENLPLQQGKVPLKVRPWLVEFT